MAAGEGIITRKEIITDEALAFGTVYKKNVDQAIDANKILIDQFKVLFKVSGDYRKAQDNYDYRKAKQEESVSHQKILNQIKQMTSAEIELEKVKRAKLRTEKEILKVAKEQTDLAKQRAQAESIIEKEIQKIKQERAKTEKELQKISQERVKTEKELSRLKIENERLAKIQAKTEINNTREIERLKKMLFDLENKVIKLQQDKIRLDQKQAAETKKKTALTMEERVQQQLANKAEKEAVLAKMGLIGAYQKLNKQRTEAKKRLLDLIATGNASNKQIRQAQREFDILDKKIRRADQAAGDFTKNVGNYKSAFAGVSNILGAFGVIGGLTGLVQLGKSIYETTKLIQGQEIALKMLSETEEVYAKNKEFLVRISEQYGLELITTTDAYKNYYASAKTAIEEGRLSFEEMQTIFEKISKSSSMLGLSVEQQEGAFLAISQMMSKGTVQSEELRGQLGERLPGAFEIMAKALNVTTMELGDMLKKGEVLAADVLPKFAVAYEKAIGADQIERVETLAAAQNRASNKWTEFVENLNGSKGTLTQVGVGFFGMTSNILDLIGAKEQLSKTIQNEQLDLNMLVGRITSANISNTERLSLIEKMKVSYPDFISFIQNEDYSNQNLINTLKQVNDNYRDRIALQIQVEEENALLKERDKVARMSLVAENNLYEQLHAMNTKYNLGLHITRDNLQESANKLQQIGKNNLSVWETGAIEYYQHTLGRLLPTLDNVNKRYDDLIAKNKTIQFSALEKIPESRRQYLEDKWEKEQAEKRADQAKNSNNSIAEETDKARRKREAAERKAIKDAEKREKERLKKQKETYEAEIDLLIWRADSKADVYKAESINEKTTQEERYNALIESQKAEEESLRLNVQKQLTLSRAFQEDKKAFTETEISDMINNIQIKSDITNDELLILEKFYAAQAKLRKDNEKGLEQNLELELKLLKEKQQSKLLQNETAMSNELDGLSIGNNLTDVENYEKAAYEIRRKYLLKEIDDNIAFYQSILQNENLTHKQKEENTKILLGLQEDLREFNNQSHVESLQKAKEMEQAFMEIGENIKNALVDLTNAIFDNRIQRIDEDIERTNEQYEKQIELYEGDAARQKLIREQQEREREKLEAKKRKEQHKQAVFNKAMSIMDIGFSTAMAIMQGYAQLGPIAGSVAAVLISILGTVQTAAVLATPIPKYKMGREGGPEELAIVGDGGVHEVIEHKDGSAEITPKRDTLVKLLEGDKVHSSIEKYRQSRRNKFKNDLVKDHIKMQTFMNKQTVFDGSGLEREIKVLQTIMRNKNMSVTVNSPRIDLEHVAWLNKNR